MPSRAACRRSRFSRRSKAVAEERDADRPEETEEEIRKRVEKGRADHNARRLERLEAIANREDERKRRDEELADVPDEAWQDEPRGHVPHAGESETPEDERELREEPAPEEEPPEIDEARKAGAVDVKSVNGETYYLLVINGQEVWRTLPEIRATAQKVEAADAYLKEAKEAATRVIREPPSAPQPGEDEVLRARTSRVRELLSRALMGEQEAVDELASVVSQAPPSAVTPDVVRLVDERVDGRLTFREAVTWFENEYREELSSPTLKAYVVRRDKELAYAHPDMDFKKRLGLAGDEVRQMRKELGVTPRSRQEKEVRKASVRTPIPAASVRQEEEDEGEDESRSDTIAKMARARGQARPTVHKPTR